MNLVGVGGRCAETGCASRAWRVVRLDDGRKRRVCRGCSISGNGEVIGYVGPDGEVIES